MIKVKRPPSLYKNTDNTNKTISISVIGYEIAIDIDCHNKGAIF